MANNEFYNIKVGDAIGNHNVSKVYSRNNGKFVIYELNNSGIISYRCEDDIGKNIDNVNEVLNDVILSLTTKWLRRRYSARIADSIKDCLIGKFQNSNNKLKSILSSILYQKTIAYRIQYLMGTISTSLLIVLIILVFRQFNIFSSFELNIVMFGLAGGIFSVAFNLSNIKIDILSNNKFLHYISGSSRSIIAGLSSIIMYVLIKADIMLGIIEDSSNYVFYTFAIISGFAENYVPNILIRKTEEKSVES